MVDVFLYVAKLGNALGYQVPFLLFVYLFASGIVLTRYVIRLLFKRILFFALSGYDVPSAA